MAPILFSRGYYLTFKYEIMKKLLIVGGIILSFSAANLFANGSFNSNGQAQGLSSNLGNDTTPKKKDTTTKKDTSAFAYNAMVSDTTPKKGDTTTKKKDTLAFAYAVANLDTVPKKDTTKKKDSLTFAYVAVNLDTVPKKDTSKKKTDSLAFAYAFNDRK